MKEILKLDELRSCSRNDQKKRKIGILLQLPGQTSERNMYNNQCGTENFRIFLDWLGKRIKLKDFKGYNGGLDCKRDQTGTDSYHTNFKNYEIMFHVSTLLPYSEGNDSSSAQQLARKRHIGNDIITIIFQDEPKDKLDGNYSGAIELNENPPLSSNLQLPFEPDTIKSHFQHVFLIIRASGRDERTRLPLYQIEVVKSRDIPAIPPSIAHFGIGSVSNNSNLFVADNNLREFILSKLINAENLAKTFAHNFKFAECCTRKNLLEDLVTDYGIGEKLVKPMSKLNMFAATTRRAFGLKPTSSSNSDRHILSSSKSSFDPNDQNYLDINSRAATVQNNSDCYNNYKLTKTDCKGGLAWPIYLKRPKHGSVSNSSYKISALLAISWCRVVLIVSDKDSDRVIFSIPSKSVLGWQAFGKQYRLFYGNCEAIRFFITTGQTAGYQALALSKDPSKDITYRLANCTPGHDCLTLNPKPQTSLKSGKKNPVHNFEIDSKFRIISVETKSHAYQIGLRPGHLILEANKILASDFESYHDLRKILEEGRPLSILVVPAPTKRENMDNLHSENIYHRIPKLSYGLPAKTQIDPPPLSSEKLPSINISNLPNNNNNNNPESISPQIERNSSLNMMMRRSKTDLTSSNFIQADPLVFNNNQTNKITQNSNRLDDILRTQSGYQPTTPKLNSNSNPMWLPPHNKYYKEVQKAQPKMNEPFSAKNKNSERIINLHKSVPNIDGSDMSNPLSQDIFISNQPRGAQSIMNLLGPDDQNQNNEYFQQPNNNNLITPNVPREKEYRGPRDYRPKYSTQISSQDIVINQINRSISKESSTKNIIADTTYSREEISSKSQEINTPENVQNFGSNNAMLGNQITNQEERGSENRRYTQYLPDRLKSPIRNILAKSQDEGVLSVRRASLNETLSRGEKTSSLGLRLC